MSRPRLLSARNIRKSYPSPSGGSVNVLRGIDLELHRGEIMAVMGMSGVGKSTLLNIIGLLDTHSDGHLLFHLDGRDVDVGTLSPLQQAQLRNRFLGFVFQSFHLLPDLDVLENVLLPAMIGRTPAQFRRQRESLEEKARDLLRRVGVSDREAHRSTTLSGGERQRVAIARALMNEPALLLCDEPTGNLDVQTSERIHVLFRELNEVLSTTILIVTHDPHLAAQAHTCLSMVDGRFVEQNAPSA